ncbi:hypothetical protein N7540_004558 [Penicillium herquei]|nr:hypothetical protein N7540_004558 [Penicillium herquei]
MILALSTPLSTPSLESGTFHDYYTGLMQSDNELLSLQQWHHDDLNISAGNTYNSIPDFELYMNMPGTPQSDHFSQPGTFSLKEFPMPTPCDATLPSWLPTSPPLTRVNSATSTSQPKPPTSIPESENSNNSHCCPAHEQIVQLLLSRGANVNIQNASGRTPLHIAAQQGHLGIVRLLLASKYIDVNAQDRCGATPLHLASENGHVVIVQLLVAHNARLDVRATTDNA